jgi:hypothetical protein
MTTLDWIKQELSYGYDSGNAISRIPSRLRRSEEKRMGGSFRNVFNEAIRPLVRSDSQVLEYGANKGTWTRPMMDLIPNGTLQTIDFEDVTEWLRPSRYDGRLTCHQVFDDSFSIVDNDSIDFVWSMGVLCHRSSRQIGNLLGNLIPKVKFGGYACLHFADWTKLDQFGWDKGGIPIEFQNKSDDEIWWPRNETQNMSELAIEAGWQVRVSDFGLLQRDGLMLLQRV